MLTGNGMDATAPSPLTAYGADADSGSHAPSAMMNAPTMLPVTPPLPGLTEHGGVVPPEQQYQAARRGAGLGLLLAVTGTGVGFWIGGPLGAGSGLLLVGAARNTLRATRDWRSPDATVRQEAGTSAALALFGALLGGYLGYRVYEKRTGE